MYLEINWLEWSGAVTGLCGAYLLARNDNASRYGWRFFLAANIFIIAFSIEKQHIGLLVQQIGFTATSLYGLHKTLRKRSERSKNGHNHLQSLEAYYEVIPCEASCDFGNNPTKCRECHTTHQI